MTPEFSRPVSLDTISITPRAMTLSADEAERLALSRRFALLSLDRLEATLTYEARDGGVLVTGHFDATFTQPCAATGKPVPASLSENFKLRFIPPGGPEMPADEIEIDAEACDEIEHDGRVIDLGEAVAQTLGLSLDPFPRAPDADDALRAAGVLGEHETGPFAALKGLLGKT